MKKKIFILKKIKNSSKPRMMVPAMTRLRLVFLKNKEKFETPIIDLTRSTNF